MKQNEQENHEISNFNLFGLMDKGNINNLT